MATNDKRKAGTVDHHVLNFDRTGQKDDLKRQAAAGKQSLNQHLLMLIAVGEQAMKRVEKLDVADAVIADLHHLKAVLTILSHTFGGDCSASDRPEELQLCLVIQWASNVAERSYLTVSESTSTYGDLATELMEMSALLTLIDTTNLALDMKIAFNDELMSGYLDALAKCAERALRMINAGNAVESIRERRSSQHREAEGQVPHPAKKTAKAA
ncbi:hypothetical protein EC845_0123 [Comamonas sp. BIGb0124]|uniref:hypothetical protein n=1 Tax=Comamonas sp. BIGb0124 TaxID=2485130 RepID=UPI000FAB0A82|nr:hypothetical protein [Comamonas sp. BIGb0124]ROR26564.1 hypothetical protein EC845_0123 [Comamonas sp. BIGb0124]